MLCIGVFVDAGYLFAQGSVALTGAKKPRSALSLNESAAISELLTMAQARCGNAPLLRIYWYDASTIRGLSLEHTRLAYTDSVKLRLGQINSEGQQKGVDSLIVTDLIELARNRAITDAVLMSGDEDVRIGVTIAQSYGVRVHLLGIKPSRGSQSHSLLQEADTTTEWGEETVSRFLSVEMLPASQASADKSALKKQIMGSSVATGNPMLDEVVATECSSLATTEMKDLVEFCETQTGLPSDVDGRLLAKSREAMGRDLEQHEKRAIRKAFKATITKEADALSEQ